MFLKIKVIFNKIKFEKLLKKDIKKAIDFATNNPTGYYSSSVIEEHFLRMAKTIPVNKTEPKNTFLHIATALYNTGGHSRILERWANSGEHHIAILYPDGHYDYDKLKNVTLFGKEDDLIKAQKLRDLAMNYEYIVLHVHPFDYIPIIAFGHPDFPRPVIFFNHADHLFWLGVSISDIIADIKEKGQKISLERRFATKSFLLKTPIDKLEKKLLNKKEAREKLGLPKDAKIIITIGSEYKYLPFKGNDFIKNIMPIITEDKDVFCLGIGPSTRLKRWKKAHNRIKPLGNIDYHNEYFDYISAADLVIDGIPIGGGTALTDALNCDKPVLTMDNALGQFDYLITSSALCKNKQELKEKALKILNDEKYAKELVAEVKAKLNKDHSIEKWQKRLEELIRQTPKQHKIHHFKDNVKNIDFAAQEMLLK